ncbi:hypothetical protein SAMN05444161_9264 [Rhizobiales bacterium GAS191]|nr:hypothetical protein SAMN05444161_9264 [Rhizobiales bacterium GAS191]
MIATKPIFARRMTDRELTDLTARLNLAVDRMSLAVAPSRETRLGSRLELFRVHWVRPKLAVEVTFSTWTAEGLFAPGGLSGVARGQAGHFAGIASERPAPRAAPRPPEAPPPAADLLRPLQEYEQLLGGGWR